MTKRRAFGTVFITAGALLLAAALGLTVWNQIENFRAGSASASSLSELSKIAEDHSPSDDGDAPFPSEATADGEMETAEVDSLSYIGYLSFPSLGLELPVQADWNYDLLNYSPCRYYGSVYTDDLIIAAHNYRNHFGRLDNLNIGDEVIFISVSGVRYNYRVAAFETIFGEDVDAMLSGGYDLTLYTCTLGGYDRITVRCEKI